MEFIVKSNIVPERTRALLDAKGVENGVSVEWNVGGGAELTEAEMKALRKKHKTRGVNYRRASEVKGWMLKGKRRIDIVMLLRREYGERMISADHAALAPLLNRGGGKK